ncbi:MAG: 4-hydroxy-tetrahydrodipicolinate synthase [Rhodospirillaceae bacterium]|nr:4-hydroxy-tetrahydrodipicolinate synthase [Rhodospirillaceae bacterium]
MFRGSMTALVTPFTADGVDERAFQDLVEWQIAEGTEAVVPCGTTGESPTLSHAEHMRVVELCVEAVGGRIPVIAGTGSNSTEEAIQLTRHAQEAGASAALVVVPYYNKPTQAGLYAHYEAIHNATDLPIIIYNIPGRSVVDMSVETMARLAELPNIVGVKDATNDLGRPALTRRAIGEDFVQLSGEDLTVPAFLAQGGHGCISVTANAAPAQCAKLHRAWREGDLAAFAEVRDSLVPLHRALFLESSPAPVKYALSVLGKVEPRVRKPLVEPGEATRLAVRTAMAHAGLIPGSNV